MKNDNKNDKNIKQLQSYYLITFCYFLLKLRYFYVTFGDNFLPLHHSKIKSNVL